MAKDIPVRTHLMNFKVEKYSDLIRSHRLSAGMTQKTLSEKIHSYVSPRGANIISDYEKGRKLPDLEKTYLLSKALGLDPNSFFKMILREHYANFIHKHFANFSGGNAQNKLIDNRYYFCGSGKIEYSFKNFLRLIEDELKLKMKSTDDLKSYLRKYFSRSYIDNVFKGTKCPSTKIVIKISEYLEISAINLYKVMIEDKALGHAKNMIKEWEAFIIKFREKN